MLAKDYFICLPCCILLEVGSRTFHYFREVLFLFVQPKPSKRQELGINLSAGSIL